MLINKDTFLIEVADSKINTIGAFGIKENIRIDTDYNKYKHATQIGKIIATPIRITSKYSNDTPLKVGDVVIFHHFVCQPDHKTNLGDNIYRAEYFHIYGKMEEGNLVAIEDMIFVDPILEPEENMFCGVLQIKPHREYLKQQGIVFAASKKAKACGVNSGDKVFYTKSADYTMNVENHLLYRMRIRNIMAIERDGDLVCLSDKVLVKFIPQESMEGVLFSFKQQQRLLGEVYKVGAETKGVKVGEKVVYSAGASGSIEYKGEIYSLLEYVTYTI